jgi:hypothetical protein
LALTFKAATLIANDNTRAFKGARDSVLQLDVANRVARIANHDLDRAKSLGWLSSNGIDWLLRCVLHFHAPHGMPPLLCAAAKYRIELGIQS